MCAMTGYVEVASSVDVASLERWDADVEVVQFQQPLREADYRSLAAWLSRHPSVALRVYGFDRELTTLGFLRWFPHVRRLSVDELYYLTDLTPLQHLDRCVEWLDIGQTLKPLDLRPLAGLQHVRQLRVVGHRRGLGELIEANAGLQGLALWRLPVDRILPGLMLPDLQSLAVTRGSLTDSGWLGQFRTLRYLALRAVRTLVDLQPVAGMVGLRWLWLDGPATRLRQQHRADPGRLHQHAPPAPSHSFERVGRRTAARTTARDRIAAAHRGVHPVRRSPSSRTRRLRPRHRPPQSCRQEATGPHTTAEPEPVRRRARAGVHAIALKRRHAGGGLTGQLIVTGEALSHRW
jgi:hypothetical protein